MAQIIVVGGGLSGLSAAHTVLENGGRVVVLDKNSFLGGNSTKATSGINGALTKTQVKLGIPDSAEKFYEDTARSARELLRAPLVKVLTGNSASAVEWLQEKFGLDLSLVSRLGGHSFPRTHRGKEKFPGMTITYALMEKLEDIVKAEPHRARIVKNARVTRLIQNNEGTVVGVEYETEGKILQETGPVILATGGYAADFAENGLIKQIRPDIFHLPTTNGDWSTGDGIKMVRAIGGNAIDLEKVQVHPTGLVDLKEPDAKVKFLAAEALRGVGGILLDNQAQRFCDELGHRDYVTGEMWKRNKPPYRLVLNGAAGKEIEWHCKHYMGRGLMKHFQNGEALAKEIGVSPSVLEETLKSYNSFAENKNDPFGKKYFHNLPFSLNDEFWVAIVTPVVHYCMGGLEISAESEVLSGKNAIKGLFAAGEVAGGVHGANRLGGSSLLGCVVFGRVAGNSASRYLMGTLTSRQVPSDATTTRRVASLSQQLSPSVQLTNNDFKVGATITQPFVQTRVEVEPNQKRLNLEIVWTGEQNGVPSVKATGTPSPSVPTGAVPATPASPAAPAEAKEGSVDRNREYTMEEVAKHNTEKDCWVVVNGQVLDVTKFLKDHPGGKKAILIYAGRDASEEFNMLHKPDVVDKYAAYTVIGKLKGASTSGHSVDTPSSSSPGKEITKPSNEESWLSGGTADILPAERKKATFDAEKLTNLLDGGPEMTKKRRFIMSPNKGADLSLRHNWDTREQLKQHVKHFMAVHEGFWDSYRPTREEVVWMTENAIFSGSLMNHYGLFLSTIEMHASDEQKEWWSSRARTMKIVGSYAQTELGHGSNVRGLQTTAEYDKKSQQFILNTPTLRSMKWWPGTLGKVATHAVVYAQLIIDGKEHGVHSFMLQLRDENHKPLPGIELGDLGPKLGDHANDTGFMRLKDVKIPREFMLARYQHVTPDGHYVKSEAKEKNARLHYTTMIFTRGFMLKTAGGYLARAATIATRYSAVRQQGFVEHKKSQSYKSAEKAIIDYQVQRYRVFRQIAIAYAIKFTGTKMLDRFKDLEGGVLGNLKQLDALPEIAAISGGLKGLCTYMAWQGIEDLRKACGGNGFLMSSGVAPLAANYVWQTTAEGDWTLLLLSTAQFLLKSVQSAMSGKHLTETVSYLSALQDGSFNPETAIPIAEDYRKYKNLDFLLSLFGNCALIHVSNAAQLFQQRIAQFNGKFDEAFNATALDLMGAVRAHCFAFMLSSFNKVVKDVKDEKLHRVLSQLGAFFGISIICDDQIWTGLIQNSQMNMVKQASAELMDELRPNAIALVDAFDIPDNVLMSTIGKYDGNVYEALYETALKAPLNQSDPFDGYKEYLQPHLDLEFLKNGNKVPSPSSSPAKL